MSEAGHSSATRNRVDKWLFFARIVKSRTLAQGHIRAGRVRVNSNKIASPAATCAPGDVLTVTLDRQVKVLRILAPGERRGPAPEARLLYEDLTPAPVAGENDTIAPASNRPAPRDEGAGRPTKKERREMEKWHSAAEGDD
ncbi:MAG: RNA-binding S4 domain-containing protein [Pseudomonadota bacterium]